MALGIGSVISGKYAGSLVSKSSTPILEDIKSTEFLNSVNVPFTDFNGIQRFTQENNVRVTYYSGGESVVQADNQLLQILEGYVKRNARWRSLTPQQQQAEIRRNKEASKREKASNYKIMTIIWAIITPILMIIFACAVDEMQGLMALVGLFLGILGWIISIAPTFLGK